LVTLTPKTPKKELKYFGEHHINGIGGTENVWWVYEERVSEKFAHRRCDIGSGIESCPLGSCTSELKI
jgi:hypothetical protein